MSQFGGKSKIDSKRHFTVVMGGGESALSPHSLKSPSN